MTGAVYGIVWTPGLGGPKGVPVVVVVVTAAAAVDGGVARRAAHVEAGEAHGLHVVNVVAALVDVHVAAAAGAFAARAGAEGLAARERGRGLGEGAAAKVLDGLRRVVREDGLHVW